MASEEQGRVEITAAEAAYLTLESWAAIAIGSEINSCYCGSCDGIDAVLVVGDYYLSLNSHGVIVKGTCKNCGEELQSTYGILNPQLIEDVLTMTRGKRIT
ncbi:hypothetical protein MUN81_06500 [Hymenobacter sp. 5317J-9]|uniref:hypothetical protein n=1 Tax=Hymenobacter sp. 5317J-9 TaxID=2932250 RepID=UPI001FD69796|nr:hypothetical protein [Hymenobacter sp. 5317J-9]UOQ99138.1 hypothetical protein MUN81_06500 [Hymenobacter sp. 5317J-9]